MKELHGQINILLYKNTDLAKLNIKYFLKSAEWLISPTENKNHDINPYVFLQQAIYGWNAE